MRRFLLDLALLPVLLLVPAACRSRPRESAVMPIPSSEIEDAIVTTPPRSLFARYPLRPHTQWIDRVETRVGATFVQKLETIEERWIVVDETTWDVVERAEGDASPEPLATRFALRSRGIFAIGTRFSGAFDPYDAPHLWLPIDVHLGQTWTETHVLPAEPRERACRIDRNEACAGGLAIECTKRFSGGDVTTNRHLFCEGIGWSGYSSTVTEVDGKTIVERRVGSEVRDLVP